MIVWCEDCQRIVTHEPQLDHQYHRLAGIREDILNDQLKRLVQELRRTDRLSPIKS